MAARLPLPTLLSQVLVAFTIEFDNESEHRLPHRTTAPNAAADSRRGPWLVSMAMWSNFMQFVTADGVPLHELDGQARITNLAGLQRWRYVVVEPDPADSRPKPPRADWLVRPTPGGRRAQRVWRPLADEIEKRWQARFGAAEISGLRVSLQAVTRQLDLELPFYLPVVGHQMFAAIPRLGWEALTRRQGGIAPGLDLSVLLSRALLAFALDFERESQLSLTISANALRVLGDRGAAVRDLPRLAGVSKEAISMSVGFLERSGYVAVEPDPAASRTEGPAGSGGVPTTAWRHRGALGEAVRRGQHRRATGVAAGATRPGRRRAAAHVPGTAAVSGRVAGAAAVRHADHRRGARPPRDAAALSHGASPRRVARRQLTG